MKQYKQTAQGRMRAVTFYRYGGPEVLQVEDVLRPVPRDKEILIRVCSATVSATDSIMRRGSPFSARLAMGLLRPGEPILGTEFSGVVEQPGAAVEDWQVGDALYGASGDSFGAHAQYICLPADGAVSLKPAGITHSDSAALAEGFLTAIPFLRDAAKLQSGQSLLVNGASGAVGSAAVQYAKHCGAHVTGVCSAANVDFVRSLGAEHVIDYRSEDFTRGENLYDVVFDTVGKSGFRQCRKVLKPQGIFLATMLSVGILLQMLATSRSRGQRAKIIFAGLRSRVDKRSDLQLISELARSGSIKSQIEKRYSLEDARLAHLHVDSGHKVGNVVFELQDSIPSS